MAQKRCFVVMGFGKKTDYTTGRTLDLDKSYQYLIKPVLLKRGWECVRADEIANTGNIELQMYRELLNADIVIADLSTTNANAIYELGIRYALRPFSTILMAEDKLAVYPFDINHIKIAKYTHLGDSIDYGEVERFHGVLNTLLDAVTDQQPPQSDSPVYTFITDLIPPALKEQLQAAINTARNNTEPATETIADSSNKTLAILCNEGEDAIKEKNFAAAKDLFTAAFALKKTGNETFYNNDPYVVHRLALATYKTTDEANAINALNEALTMLGLLDLDHTNDPETVAMAGSIEKKLFERGQGEEHLKNAILFNERGYFLLNNRYNGINLAYTFNCRVDTNLYTKKEDKIADMIYANRVRTRVLMICDRDWTEITKREAAETLPSTATPEDIQKQKDYNNEQKFWILVNKAESLFGLGDFEGYKAAVNQAAAIEHADWMMQSFTEQIAKLKILLGKYGNLLETPWVYREV